MVRKRKQKTPRRVVPRTEESQVPVETPTADNQRQRDEEPRPQAPTSPRECLLALPGIVATRIPNTESLNRLQKFLRENQPCNPQQVN